MQDRQRGEREEAFYRHLQRLEMPDEVRRLFPKFHGIATVASADGPSRFLVLSDATAGFARPCIMDIKLGRQTWDSRDSPERVEKHKQKYDRTTTPTLGIRVCGMLLHDKDSGEACVLSKKWAYQLTQQTIASDALAPFFAARPELVPIAISKIRLLCDWLQNTRVILRCSSVLLAYDAARGATSSLQLKLIDFAHSFVGDDAAATDTDCLHGLQTLLALLAALTAEDGAFREQNSDLATQPN